MREVPFTHKIVVGTISIILGCYVTYKTGSDFQYVKFTPHSPEEVERRKRENIGISMRFGDEMTLDLTPEAKQKYQKMREEKIKQLQEEERQKQQQQQPAANNPEADK